MNFRSIRLIVIVLVIVLASAWLGWSYFRSPANAGEGEPAQVEATAEYPQAVVYKSPTCGCCGKWEDHLRDHGFEVESRPTDDMNSVKAEHKVPSDLRSCHTAIIGDYVIEGHVPAEAVISLLKSQKKVAGLAVPGMPMGSPGMEGAYTESYDVIAYDGEGQREVYLKK